MINITKEEFKFIKDCYKSITGYRKFDTDGIEDELYELCLRFMNAPDEDIKALDLMGQQALEALLGLNDFIYRSGMVFLLSDIQYDTLEQKGNLLGIKPQMHMEFIDPNSTFHFFTPDKEADLFNPINTIEEVFDGFDRPLRDARIEVETEHKYLDLQGTIKKCRGIQESSGEYSVEEFMSNLKVLKPGKEIVAVASKKYDGASLIVEFNKEGKVLKALSRGEEGKGKDLSRFVNHLDGSGLFDRDFGLSFEVIIKYSDLKRLNEERVASGLKEFKNPRGAVAGILSDLGGEKYKNYLTLVPLKKNGLMDRVREIETLKVFVKQNEGIANLMEAEHYVVKLHKDDLLFTLSKLARYTVENRMSNDFMIDGLVIEIIGYMEGKTFEDIRYTAGRDENNRVNRWEIAYKFQSEAQPTILRDVSFTVGSTGKITPMAHFDSIAFSNGNTYDVASLGSIGKLRKLGLRLGDEIVVEYANDVIPFIGKVQTANEKGAKVVIPHICPCCGFRLDVSETGELRCINMKCEAKIILGIPKALALLGCKNISEGIVSKLYEAGIIRGLEDIFKLEENKARILEMRGFGEKKYNQLVDEIKSLKERSIGEQQIFAALNIANMGISTFKKILQKVDAKDLVFKVEKLWLVFDELLDLGLLSSRQLCNSIINITEDEDKVELSTLISQFEASEIKNNMMMSASKLLRHILKFGILNPLVKEYDIKYDNIDIDSLIENLADISGITDFKAIALISSFTPDKIAQYKVLREQLNVSEVGTIDSGDEREFNVAYTGFRDTDDKITSKLQKAGCNINSSVNNKTDLLIVASKEKVSSKMKAAMEKGITVVEFKEIYDMSIDDIKKLLRKDS